MRPARELFDLISKRTPEVVAKSWTSACQVVSCERGAQLLVG